MFPGLLFEHTLTGEFITIHSDEPLPVQARSVLESAERLALRSELIDRARRYDVFVCNASWRWNYFTGFKRRGRAVATGLGRAVYTRSARWEDKTLLGPRGDSGPRSLDRYVVHEAVHIAVLDHLGMFAAERLPTWLREGYADYIGRHGTFKYEKLRQRLIAGDPVLTERKGDPYLLYVLLVSHLLDPSPIS